MQDLLNFVLKIIAATLFLYLINTIFNLNIPYHQIYIILIAFLGVRGVLIVLILMFLF